jgi:hypothetical protein
VSVRITVDDRQQQAAFDRLLNMGAAVNDLERILVRQFDAGQRAVHVITGSLRGSEDLDSDYRAGRWTGRVSFGGPSPGFVNDPVVYAVYEAARGGPHDFRRPIEALGSEYHRAVRAHLEKGR